MNVAPDLAKLIDRYDARVPRYTSYPTAPHFQPADGDALHRRWLSELTTDEPVSLYVHVPFCEKMCWYCGCHTQVAKSYQPVTSYVGQLTHEIGLVADAIGKRLKVAHLHWGGGTPTMLTPDDFLRLIERLTQRFDFLDDAEIAIEIDPRTLSPGMIDAFRQAGVNRASLGVQTFDAKIQAAVNRIQPYDCVRDAVDGLRAIGIQGINFDLMYGLPGQTVDDLTETIDRSKSLDPTRLALFGYAHVPWMKSHQKKIDEAALPDAPARFAQAAGARARLAELGYRAIGLDHFARADDELARAAASGTLWRNFQGYTTDQADTLIGFGASAISSLPQGYAQNDPGFRGWEDAVAAGRLPTARTRALDDDDRRRRAAIMRLMCDEKVDLASFADPDGFVDVRRRLEPMAADGLVEIAGDVVAMTDLGRPFLRAAAAAFDRYLDLGIGRHSRGT